MHAQAISNDIPYSSSVGAATRKYLCIRSGTLNHVKRRRNKEDQVKKKEERWMVNITIKDYLQEIEKINQDKTISTGSYLFIALTNL